MKKLNSDVVGVCTGPCKDPCKPGACVHVCTHRKISRFLFSTGIVFPDIEKTRSVGKIEFQCQGVVQGPVHACTHALRVHGPLHSPKTFKFNFFNFSRLFYVRTDYANWKENSGIFSIRARKNARFGRGAPCSVIHVCSISQTRITEQGAPRPKRAFLRARIEKIPEFSFLLA